MEGIPEKVEACLTDYIKHIEKQLPRDLLVGVYLYGSISLGAFDEEKSDIDFITLLKRDLTKEEGKCVKSIHQSLNVNSLGQRMDGMYLSIDHIGKTNGELSPYFYCSDGKVKKGYWDINAVTWWMLENNGIKVQGKRISDLSIRSKWNHVVENMKFNVDTYWLNKAKHKIMFVFDDMVEFCVLTLSRILSTLEVKKILTKVEALKKVKEILPQRWHLLLEEGGRLRHNPKSTSLYQSRVKRAVECRKFIFFVYQFCHDCYFDDVREMKKGWENNI